MYIECPNCNAIFTAPDNLKAPRVRCGECDFVFQLDQASKDLVPDENHDLRGYADADAEIDKTAAEIQELIDASGSITEELDADIDRIERSNFDHEKALEDDFMFESRRLGKLDDTVEMPVIGEPGANDLFDEDIFEEFIASNELSTMTDDEGGGIRAKADGSTIDDPSDLLPAIDMDADYDDDQDLDEPRTVLLDKLASTADDLFIQEAPPNSVFADDDSLIDDDPVQIVSIAEFREELERVAEENLPSATNDGLLEKQAISRTEQAPKQTDLGLEAQEDLPGLDDDADPDDALNESDEAPDDTLISLQQVELDQFPELEPNRRPPLLERKMVRSGLIALVLLLLLGAQYMRHNREYFASHASTKPVIQAICAISGCTISPQRRPDEIRILERSIYPHETLPDTLTIRAKVVNTAGDHQPFPVFVVSFYDLTGKKVAARRFGPSEYLSQTPDASLLRSQQPVFFQVDVADPGRQGVSFDLRII